MKNRHTIPGLALLLAIHAGAAWPHAVTPEDQKLIDEAPCAEIEKQYGIHVAEEKAVVEEIRKTNSGTAATNVVGAATLAIFGVGFFTWDNSVDAEHNLAELRSYKDAIAASGRKKGCKIPA